MAVYFRHGSNGSYKSAYAVWFEILPALRQGRLVVTNIEGMKPLEELEKLLGEKFPVGARLVRIFSRNDKGVELWQNWYNWMPVTALVVIDESQDLYCKEVGFVREKALARPLSEFLPNLPEGWESLFNQNWDKADTSLESGDVDDIGETQLDEEGRLLYPHNFYGAFMRHRKYHWDIIMLTPDWTSIPTWLKQCAQEAYSHRSTDTFFRKRRPRIFNHRPTSTKIAPTTKQEFTSCSSKKIPVEVFGLYQSTGTGSFSSSKSDISMLKSPKFILVILVALLAIGNFIREANNIFNSDDEVISESSTTQSENSAQASVSSSSDDLGENKEGKKDSNGVDSGNDSNKTDVQIDSAGDVLNPFSDAFPMFNGASSIYLTSTIISRKNRVPSIEYVFKINMDAGVYYLSSNILERYGYKFTHLDYCMVDISIKGVNSMMLCSPDVERRDNRTLEVDNSSKIDALPSLAKSGVDIFNM